MSQDFGDGPTPSPPPPKQEAGITPERLKQLRSIRREMGLQGLFLEEALDEIDRLHEFYDIEMERCMDGIGALERRIQLMEPVVKAARALKNATDEVQVRRRLHNLAMAVKAHDDVFFPSRKEGAEMGSPHLCLHANEVPQNCPCQSDCYCREAGNTCNAAGDVARIFYGNKHPAIEVMRKWVELYDQGKLEVLESMQHQDWDTQGHPDGKDLVRMRRNGGMKLAISVKTESDEWGEWFVPARLKEK